MQDNKRKNGGSDSQKPLAKSQAFNPRAGWLDTTAAMLLALATVCSAWSAYQATRWNGLVALNFGEAYTSQLEVTRLTNVMSRKITVDVYLFVNYATALNNNNLKFADFLENRFRPELKAATEAWLAAKPLQNANAPASPFDLNIYSLPEESQIETLSKKAADNLQSAKQARQFGDNYVLLTVLFASVLFFAGVAVKYRTSYLKLSMFIIGIVIFLTAVAMLIIFPKH